MEILWNSNHPHILLNIHQVLFSVCKHVAAGRKKGSMETWDDRKLDNHKQHILVRKRWVDTIFFPGSNMLARWVTLSNTLFETLPLN